MASDYVIRVENLAKRYRIGLKDEISDTLVGAITSFIRRPLKNLKNLSRLTQFHEEEAKDIIWALRDVSFDVAQGEVVGIIGRNGAGKSTLLKVLSRITEPTSGQVRIRGRVSSLLEVGTGFHPELTGRENIYLNGTILGMRKAEIDRKFAEIVDFSGVEKFLDTPVKRYSSGMYVRLAFAVAAHLEPEILIVDEVLAVGDAQFQKKCLGKMSEVAKGGRTVLFVSHNMAAIQQLTRTSICLESGKIGFIGSTQDTIEYYLRSMKINTGTVYEVENDPRPFFDQQRLIQFVRLEITDFPTKIVPADAALPLRIGVRGNSSVDKFRFSLTIFRSDGTPVGSVFSPEICSIEKDELSTFQLILHDLNLAPGIYHCGLAVGKGNNLEGYVNFDTVLDVLHFEVMAPEGMDGTLAEWSPWWGAIRFRSPDVAKVGGE